MKPYTIESDEGGRFVVRLVSEPEFIHGLWMSPPEREPFLNEGDWIVLAFAIWNAYDYPLIEFAIDAVKSMNGRVRLGIRPYSDGKEFSTWSEVAPFDYELASKEQQIRGAKRTIALPPHAGITPLWLVFRNGEIVHSHFGPLSVPKIRAMIEKNLP